MTKMVTDILRHRLDMRSAEFGFPLSAERIAAIVASEITPETFDYARAEATPIY